MRRLVLPLLLSVAACGDIDVRSIRSGNVVPATLAGEWEGSWQSANTAASGPIRITVQQFDGQPLLGLQIDNPCLTAREYEVVLRSDIVQLRADGQPVFAGVVDAERVLNGNYECGVDRGTWTATWLRDLPPVGDLSGSWEGSIGVLGTAPRAITCDLAQRIVGGLLKVEGFLSLPDLLPMSVPVDGVVNWRDSTFDIVLQTTAPGLPVLLFSALGQRDPLGIEFGIVQVFPQNLLPFNQGTFSLRPRN
jgi:hypothetical protein